MEYTILGRTGVRVSRLGWGGAPAGLKDYLRSYDPEDPAARQGVVEGVQRALELGVNYFDTAPAYGRGASESILGEALQNAETDQSVFIASKYGPWQKQALRESVAGSLERLGRDHIDLLQLHGLSYTMDDAERILAPDGMADRMEALREEGLVRYIGFTSEDNNDALYRLIKSNRFDVMQICYNFVNQHPYDPARPFGSLLVAEEHGLGIAAMRPTTSGLFQKWIQNVRPGDNYDYTPALIQFVFSNPLVDVVLVGMRSAARVEQNVALLEDADGRIDIEELFSYYEG